MDRKLLEILACPVCKGDLLLLSNTSELVCRIDKLAFPIREGIPVMIENEARKISLEEYDSLPKRTPLVE